MEGQPVRLALRSLSELCRRAERLAFTGDLILREHDGIEHHVVFRSGTVVDVRVRGHFDPILKRLFDEGSLDPRQLVCALEGLGQSRRRAGDLALELGVPRRTIDRALAKQGERRFSTLVEIARARGRDAWLVPRPVRPGEVAFRLMVGRLLRRRTTATTTTAPRSERAPPARDRRRALRRLAFALHPDRHQNLSDAERDRLRRRLAEVTAAYHRL
jgi:DNA-binding phage protein